MKARSALSTIVAFTIVLGIDSRTLQFWNVWLKRPYKGSQLVIEVVGADLNKRANRFFDFWSKPDTYIKCEHGDNERKTQIEPNTYTPRYLWQSKMPYESNTGFRFRVMEANVIKGDDVVGRAHISAADVRRMMKSREFRLLRIGDGIGSIVVRLSRPAEELRMKGWSTSITKPLLEGTTATLSSQN
mmetsp:Transcript_5650/g.7075  ORF Transcript_5650/g.7075 Transcript_5650/m.7075 type:complete len:187 (+) Transcript_5650:62-622(+)